MQTTRRALAVATLAIAACQGNPINTPIRSFDRPSDVALLCAIRDARSTEQIYNVVPLSECGAFTDRQHFAQPLWCDEYEPGNLITNYQAIYDGNGCPTQQVLPELYAVVTQSARGELALVGADRGFIRDLDPVTPGFNFLPVGQLPEHVRTSPDSCRAVTANVDTCDLSLIQLPQMLNMGEAPFRNGGQGDGGIAYGTGPGAPVDDAGAPILSSAPPFGAPVGGFECNSVPDGGLALVCPNITNPPPGAEACPGFNQPIPNVQFGQTAQCPYGGRAMPRDYAQNVVTRVTPTVNGKPLNARPSWLEMSPELPSAFATGENGTCTAGRYTAWVAMPGCQLVAEIALENVSGKAAGEVLQAIQVTKSGGAQVVSDLSTISCPDECGSVGAAPNDDAGTPLEAAPSTIAIEPLDPMSVPDRCSVDTDCGSAGMCKNSRCACKADDDCAGGTCTNNSCVRRPVRIVIGDAAGEKLWVVPFSVDSSTLGVPRSITLETGAVGVDVVRISPRGAAGKFLYAVAHDASVRVIDLDVERECETNPDPRFIADPRTGQQVPTNLIDPTGDARRLGCFPLGDPSTPPRSPFATTPGIVLGGGALPKDIAFVHLNQPVRPIDPTNQTPPPQSGGATLMGDFAWIIGSDGRSTAIDIFDQCLSPNNPQVVCTADTQTYSDACITTNIAPSLEVAMPGRPVPLEVDRLAHRTRLATNRFLPPNNCDDQIGAPRLEGEGNNGIPYQLSINGQNVTDQLEMNVPDGGFSPPILYPRLAEQTSLATPPNIAFSCATSASNGCVQNQRFISFPDIDHVKNETWTIAWEGLIPGTARALGRPRVCSQPFTGECAANPALVTWVDTGALYCAHGVQGGDTLHLTGCTSDSDCDFSQTCQVDPHLQTDVTTGMCFDRLDGGPNLSKLVQRCAPILDSEREYRVVHARQNATPRIAAAAAELTDELTLQEIYEPQHRLAFDPTQGKIVDNPTCDPSDSHSCDGVTVPANVDTSGVATGALPTECLRDYDDGSGRPVFRCYRSCTLGGVAAGASGGGEEPDGGTVDNHQCGSSYICANSQMGDVRCMRAPLQLCDDENNKATCSTDRLVNTCLREAQVYSVHAGGSFVVSGSSSGFVSAEVPNANASGQPLDPTRLTGECIAPPVVPDPFVETVRLRQSRIPIVAPACPTDAFDPSMFATAGFVHPIDIVSLINDCLLPGNLTSCTIPAADLMNASALNPLKLPLDRKALLATPNVCQYHDPSPLLLNAYLLRYENAYFVVAMDLPIQAGTGTGAMSNPSLPVVPPDLFALQITVIGGSAPQLAPLAVDSQAQQPRATVTAPDGQTYFVVDEGKSTIATALRGQLLRMQSSPPGADRFFIVR